MISLWARNAQVPHAVAAAGAARLPTLPPHQLQAQPRYAEWLNTWAELLSAVLSWDFSRADDAEGDGEGLR